MLWLGNTKISQSWIPCLTVFSFSTKNKKALLQYQQQTEEPLSLQQSLGAGGPDVSGTVAKKLCDATSQTTGMVLVIRHSTNAGTQSKKDFCSQLWTSSQIKLLKARVETSAALWSSSNDLLEEDCKAEQPMGENLWCLSIPCLSAVWVLVRGSAQD